MNTEHEPVDVLALSRQHYGQLLMRASREREGFLRRIGGEPRTVAERIRLLHLDGKVDSYRQSARNLR